MTLRTVSLNRVVVGTVVLTVATAAAGSMSDLADPLSIGAGAAFMLVNFGLLRMLVSRLTVPGASKTSGLVILGGKFALFLLLIAGVVFRLPVEPGSFALGATTLLAASVLEAALLGEPVGSVEETSPDTGED